MQPDEEVPPTVVIGAPQQGGVPVQSGMAAGQPVMGVAQPGIVAGQPVMGVAQPGMVLGQPMIGVAQPGMVMGQPMAGIAQPGVMMIPNQKSKLAAGLLGVLVGALGIHNFYLGYTGKGITQLLISVLSLGICAFIPAIWGLIEGIIILTDDHAVDARGQLLKN